MGFNIRRKIGEEWADAKYTLSQRKPCEIATALFLIVLLVGSVVMAFIFTIVAPPGSLGSSSSGSASIARHLVSNQQQRVPTLYKRSVEDSPKENPDSAPKFASASGTDDAVSCVEIGSNMMENGGTSSEAAKEIIVCLGKISIPDIETIVKLEQELASALFTGNRDAAVDILHKIIQYDVLAEPKLA
ncbi:uncharacterized protein LOC105438058 [Strongylocentrotus purpuratus]|uniref:Uncharacterized protein n=1 Tax=Strongylocentrotus purpuratus TaxID=7668 RepID=A0A7M7PBW7_STRPU|nr:uncharacterized protein LOC105438058 [Strongylocentrotus purpuratus]